MKTLINPNNAAKVVALFALLVLNSIFFTACQKAPILKQEVAAVAGRDDELSARHGDGNLAVGEAEMDMTLRAAPVLIKIDHQGNKDATLPVYSVTLYKDQIVVFKGVKNVKFIGTKQFFLLDDVFQQILQYPAAFNLVDLADNYPGGVKADLSVTKIFLPGEANDDGTQKYKIIRARADKAPAELKGFQFKTEILMGIEALRGF